MKENHINTLRDVAVYFEDKAPQLSIDLMGIALKYRPQGPFIVNKFNHYSKSHNLSFDASKSLIEAINSVDESHFKKLLKAAEFFYPNNSDILDLKKKILFSYDLNSEHNLKFNNYDESDFIPIGSRCTSAVVSHYAGLYRESFPFDWTIPLTPDKSLKVIDEDFDGFIPSDIDIDKSVRNSKYNIGLAHFSAHPNIDDGVRVYNDRINRFRNVLKDNTKHKYFIYVNEDFLYRESYRDVDFNTKTFQDMIVLDDYLKEKYPDLDFNILYFDFVNHDLDNPPDSSIIPFHIKTEKLWEEPKVSTFPEFRLYIGKLLSDIFKTKFDGSLKVDDLFAL